MNPSFDESFANFQRFLSENGYPRDVIWITPDDIVISKDRLIYVKLPVPKNNEQHVKRLFDLGLGRGKGVLFDTVCENENATFSYAWVPNNDSEGERALMPKGVKMSAKTGCSRIPGKAVLNRLQWLYLQLRYRKYQRDKNQLFFIDQ